MAFFHHQSNEAYVKLVNNDGSIVEFQPVNCRLEFSSTGGKFEADVTAAEHRLPTPAEKLAQCVLYENDTVAAAVLADEVIDWLNNTDKFTSRDKLVRLLLKAVEVLSPLANFAEMEDKYTGDVPIAFVQPAEYSTALTVEDAVKAKNLMEYIQSAIN